MATPTAYYFVTDIECDGPSPMHNSMLSFATVVVREDGVLCGEFEAVLEPRADKASDATTMTFWETQPNAWKAATHEPRPPQEVMTEFVAWVETFDGTRSFAARPLMFDGMWIEHYLRDFAGRFLLDVPYWGRMVFTGGTLDIGSFISGLFGHTYPHTGDIAFPQSWLGEHEHEHTHRAIDDARGYAVLLSKLLKLARETSAHPDDFIGDRSSLKKRHEKN